MAMLSSDSLLSIPPHSLFILLFFLLAVFLLLLILTRKMPNLSCVYPKPKEQLPPNTIPASGDSPTPAPPTMVKEGEKKVAGGEGEQKKGRERGKKKKQNAPGGRGKDEERETERLVTTTVEGGKGNSEEDSSGNSGSIYPFFSFSNVTQRKINRQHELLVKSNDDEALTIMQVCQFANCLVEARKDLQHKCATIHQKITIKNALLLKADRSSFSHLSQQMCKLEREKKRLEDDAIVYNRFLEELKLSPAFKAMLEICACLEEAIRDFEQPTKDVDSVLDDCITFEELLVQEKKDSFWLRNGKLRSCTQVEEPWRRAQ